MTKIEELETSIENQEAKLFALTQAIDTVTNILLDLTTNSKKLRRMANQFIAEQSAEEK
jgi:prefoldin subunit 5